MDRTQHVGEIIASSTSRFTAQCPDEDCAPSLGAFVTVEAAGEQAIAVVSDIRVGAFDGFRRATAYGLPETELYAQQPQLRELLTTEFDSWLIGRRLGEGWRQLLPAQPPRLHGFVHRAAPEDVHAITETGDWLRTLTATDVGDDVIAAAVRAAVAARDGDYDYQVRTGQTLARLFGDDYERLQTLLRRISL